MKFKNQLTLRVRQTGFLKYRKLRIFCPLNTGGDLK